MGRNPSNAFISDFTRGKVTRTMLAFAGPLFLSNLLQAVYNMVDMIVVGRVVGEAGLSGISVGGDLLTFLTFLSTGFAGAGQIIISQYIGAGTRDRLPRFIGTMATTLLVGAVGLSVICLLLHRPILTWMNTPEAAWDQAMAYSVTCYFGLVFIYGYNAVSAILRGMGDSKRPFVFIAVAAVLNVVLDLLFVVGFGMEAFGAALATVIAQASSFVTSVVYLYRHKERLGFVITKSDFGVDWKEFTTLVKLGVPMAMRAGAILFSKLFVNAWVNDFGVTVSAVFGIGQKLDNVVGLLGNAVSTAGSSMVGQNIGAGKYDRVKRVLGSALMINGVSFSVVIILLLLFPQTIFGIFTGEAQVLAVCMEYLPIAIVSFVACALRDSMNAFSGGCGNFKFNLCVAFFDGIVGRIGYSLLLGIVFGLGYRGFWLGAALANCTPFLLGLIYYLTGWWRKKSAILAE